MTMPPVQMRHLWPLALSLAVHLLLVSAVGVRSAPQRDPNVNRLAMSNRLTVSIIEPDAVRQPAQTTRTVRIPASASRKEKHETLPPLPAAADAPVPSNEPVPDTADAAPALIEFAAPPDSYYFKTDQLDAKPQVLFDLPPGLTLALTGKSTQSAILRLLINESGDIDDVVIVESSFSQANQLLIRDALAGMKFDAGKIDNKPVKSEMKIELMIEKIAPKRYARDE